MEETSKSYPKLSTHQGSQKLQAALCKSPPTSPTFDHHGPSNPATISGSQHEATCERGMKIQSNDRQTSFGHTIKAGDDIQSEIPGNDQKFQSITVPDRPFPNASPSPPPRLSAESVTGDSNYHHNSHNPHHNPHHNNPHNNYPHVQTSYHREIRPCDSISQRGSWPSSSKSQSVPNWSLQDLKDNCKKYIPLQFHDCWDNQPFAGLSQRPTLCPPDFDIEGAAATALATAPYHDDDDDNNPSNLPPHVFSSSSPPADEPQVLRSNTTSSNNSSNRNASIDQSLYNMSVYSPIHSASSRRRMRVVALLVTYPAFITIAVIAALAMVLLCLRCCFGSGAASHGG